jgi:hypothetical protein
VSNTVGDTTASVATRKSFSLHRLDEELHDRAARGPGERPHVMPTSQQDHRHWALVVDLARRRQR